MITFFTSGSSLHPKDIISIHTVHFQNECSLRCLQTSTCVGFNFGVKSNKYVVNCQLTNKTHDRKSGESEEKGEWVFYQDVQATVRVRTIWNLYLELLLSRILLRSIIIVFLREIFITFTDKFSERVKIKPRTVL